MRDALQWPSPNNRAQSWRTDITPETEYDGPMTPLLTKEQQTELDVWYANEKTMWPDGLVPWELYQAKMMQIANSERKGT